jgi:hypothetical protein
MGSCWDTSLSLSNISRARGMRPLCPALKGETLARTGEGCFKKDDVVDSLLASHRLPGLYFIRFLSAPDVFSVCVRIDQVPEEGTVTAKVNAVKVTDIAGNINTASGVVTFIFDTTVPSLVLSTSEPSNTNENPIPVTATFSEAVTGFALADVAVTGATVDTLVAVSTSVYTMNVNPTGQVRFATCRP